MQFPFQMGTNDSHNNPWQDLSLNVTLDGCMDSVFRKDSCRICKKKTLLDPHKSSYSNQLTKVKQFSLKLPKLQPIDQLLQIQATWDGTVSSISAVSAPDKIPPARTFGFQAITSSNTALPRCSFFFTAFCIVFK